MLDILMDMETRMWGGVLAEAYQPARRALYAYKEMRCQRKTYTGAMKYGDWVSLERHYTLTSAHAAFRLPRTLVRSLRRRARWQVLALIF